MRQILERLRRFARAHDSGDLFGRGKRTDGDALLHAEELIREANERDRRREMKKFDPVAQPSGKGEERREGPERLKETEAYRAACGALGVAPDASFTEITAAYRAAMARHHPDRNSMNGEGELRRATGRAQELNRAYHIARRYHNR